MSAEGDTGRELARRHLLVADVEAGTSLLSFADRPRVGDWSLRSALVRLAQPHPLLASRVLSAARRCSASLGGAAAVLASHGVVSEGSDRSAVDVRAAELARLAAADPRRFPVELAAYREIIDLEDLEVMAIPLLGVALVLDEIAEVVAAWAETGPAAPPVAKVEELLAAVEEALDAMGVPQEELELR